MEVFVLCRDAATQARWAGSLDVRNSLGVAQFHLKLGYSSYYRLILDAIAEAKSEYILICHDDVVLGNGFFQRVEELTSDLANREVPWGVVGNAGIGADGQTIYRYICDPHGGPQKSSYPKPVLSVDGNTLLINRRALLASGFQYPDLQGFHGYDVALSLECLSAGLLVLADHRLMVVHASKGAKSSFDQFVAGPVFGKYLSSRLVNHTVPTLNGPIDLSAAIDYSYLQEQHDSCDRFDIVERLDEVLEKSRLHIKPVVTIVCRTQLDRQYLLDRAVDSIALSLSECKGLAQFQVALFTDCPSNEFASEVARQRRRAPSLNIISLNVPKSATDTADTNRFYLSLSGMETDYLWIIDEDHFLLPGAIAAVERQLSEHGSTLLIGDCQRFQETWSVPDCGPEQPTASHRPRVPSLAGSVKLDRIHASDFENAIAGKDCVPLCSAILPRRALEQQLENVHPVCDFHGDYFFLLLSLTASEIEVHTLNKPIAGIAVEDAGSAVSPTEQRRRDYVYATLMGEFLNLAQASSPAVWNLCSRHAHGNDSSEHLYAGWVKADQMYREAIARGEAELLRRIAMEQKLEVALRSRVMIKTLLKRLAVRCGARWVVRCLARWLGRLHRTRFLAPIYPWIPTRVKQLVGSRIGAA